MPTFFFVLLIILGAYFTLNIALAIISDACTCRGFLLQFFEQFGVSGRSEASRPDRRLSVPLVQHNIVENEFSCAAQQETLLFAKISSGGTLGHNL